MGALSSRAAARKDLGNPEGAIADYSEILKIDPAYLVAWANRGLARLQLGRVDEARPDLERALQLAPADWPQRPALEEQLRALKPEK